MTSGMTSYLRRLAILLGGALVLLFALNWVVDPFERNLRFDLGLQKEPVAAGLNYQMKKILEYERECEPTVVLGDSRALALQEEYFADAGLPDVDNFCYGGGTLYEAIDTFWFVVDQGCVRRVILGVPFSTWNEANSVNRFPRSRRVARNPLAYYLSPLVTKATVLDLAATVTGRQMITRIPDMAPDEFWAHQLGPGSDRYFKGWRRPEVLAARLQAVADHCRSHGIALYLFLPPMHAEQRARLSDYGLDAEFDRYKDAMRALAPVFDYAVDGPLARDRANFTDPRHVTPEVAREIVGDIVAEIRAAERRGPDAPPAD